MEFVPGSRIKGLSRSEIRIMSVECEKKGGINLSQGVCDMPLPDVLAREAKGAIDAGENHYTRFDGLEELRHNVARKLLHFNNIERDPEKEILITAGSTGAFYCACLALLNPGDEVILFEPYYGYHEYTLLALDLVPVFVRLNPPNWSFNPEELEQKISSRTRGIMINTPANPSGKVFSKKELELLLELGRRHTLYLFTDEIYEYMVYDGKTHISPGALETEEDRVITVSGYSKTFSITGWRIGYCACREELAVPIGCASDLVYVCAPSPLQLGVANAIGRLPDSYYHGLCQSYEKKRNRVCEALEEAGLSPYIPQGAYYVLFNTERLKGDTAKEKAMQLLDKTGVAVVPGSAFYSGQGGENLARLCFAKEDGILEEACERFMKLKRNNSI